VGEETVVVKVVVDWLMLTPPVEDDSGATFNVSEAEDELEAIGLGAELAVEGDAVSIVSDTMVVSADVAGLEKSMRAGVLLLSAIASVRTVVALEIADAETLASGELIEVMKLDDTNVNPPGRGIGVTGAPIEVSGTRPVALEPGRESVALAPKPSADEEEVAGG